MKKLYFIFSISIIVLIYFLYSRMDLSLNAEIIPRKLLNAPIEGKWTVQQCILFKDINSENETQDKYLNSTAEFSSTAVSFQDKTCYLPNYKAKLVDSHSYFWNNFKVNPKTIGIKDQKLEVITINSGDKYYDEYIKLDENNIVKQEENVLLFFRKSGVSEEPPITSERLIDYRNLSSANEKEIKSKSGLLLALRDLKGDYRTLWISYSNKNFFPIKEVNSILIPRMNGFWELGGNGSIWCYPIKTGTTKENYNNIKRDASIINFVGSDYISIETKDKKLEILPIDNLNSDPIKLSKIIGQDFANSLLQKQFKNTAIEELNESNWGVFRRAGRWILRDRSFTDTKNDYIDVDISYAVPKNILKYDDLYPSFSQVKAKFPDAVDMFTSVNRDFNVVLTKDELLIIPIVNGSLGEVQNKIALKQGEVPVMSHWATGFYVDEWAAKFK